MIENKYRLITIAGASCLAIVGIVAGAMLGANSHTMPDHSSVNNSTFESLVEGMTAPDGIPPNGMTVVPASADNWLGMFPYVSRVTYLNVPYETLEEGATHFVSISANGVNDYTAQVDGSFKYPILGVAYSDGRAADAAKDRANAFIRDNPYSTDAKFFTKGNVLYFIMQASYTDDQLSVSSLPDSITDDQLERWGVSEGKSYWYIDFGSFIESYRETIEDEQYVEGMEGLLSKMGINENTYWVGTSDDLKEWDGKFYNMDISNITPKEVMATFNMFYKKVNQVDETDWDYININSTFAPDGYEIHEAQSVLRQYTEVATKNGHEGTILSIDNTDGEQTLEKLPSDSPYDVRLKVDPNAWLGFLKGGALQAPQIVFMKTMMIDIMKDGEAHITVDPITLEEYVAELAVQDELAQKTAEEQEQINQSAE